MNEKVQKTLDQLVEKLTDQKTIAVSMQTVIFGKDVPSAKWSFMNRLLSATFGGGDARGYKQWQEVKRQVKKGEHSFYILAPILHKAETDKLDDHGVKVCIDKLCGFRPVPVFGYDQTDGEELAYRHKMSNINLVNFPLMDIAKKMGINVELGLTAHGEAGWYELTGDNIKLCTDNEQVFLHELSHAVDDKLGNLGEDRRQGEIVAELSACLLASLYHKQANLNFTKHYIATWSGKQHIAFTISKALERVKAIYEYIVDFE